MTPEIVLGLSVLALVIIFIILGCVSWVKKVNSMITKQKCIVEMIYSLRDRVDILEIKSAKKHIKNIYIGEVYYDKLFWGRVIGTGWHKFTKENLTDKFNGGFKISGKWADSKRVIFYKDYSPIKKIKERIERENKNETNTDTQRPKRRNKSSRRSNKRK